MKRRTILAALCALLAAAPVAARAQEGPPLSDTQLETLRGGFLVAGGYTIDFGAVLRTYVDGQLAYETQLTWSDLGAQVSRTAANGTTAVSVASLGSDVLAGLAGAGFPPTALQGAVVTSDGQTTLLQNVSAGQIANVLLNAASGRSITQDTSVTLTLPGFSADQTAMSRSALAANLAQAVGDQLIAGRH